MSARPSGARALVLGVEAEPQMRRFLKLALESVGYRWMEAETGAAALRLVAEYAPDIVLLDQGLPDMEGVDVIRELRRSGRLAILVLCARGEERAKEGLLDAGADDCLTKPFGWQALAARTRAAVRLMGRADCDSSSGVFVCGTLRIDFEARRVISGEEEVPLTAVEFSLLGVLAAHSGRILTKARLLKEAFGPQRGEETQHIRVYMTQLRRKLGAAAGILRTEAGVGYGLECPLEFLD